LRSLWLRRELASIEGQRPLCAGHVKAVGTKNFKIAELIAQAQLVIGLKLVAVAGPAQALKVFNTIRISELEPPN
jgi:hypothetical protein